MKDLGIPDWNKEILKECGIDEETIKGKNKTLHIS